MDVMQAPGIPGFTVGRLLGQGSSADVWLATEQRTGRDAAVKVFRAAAGAAPGSTAVTRDAVRREIRILSVLDHQHLVKARDAVPLGAGPTPAECAGGSLALVMDYVSGGSLGQLVAARGKLSIGETVTVLTPLAQVLSYLHGKGFTHGDVSPGNVLFTGQGKPVLSDLGIARMLGDPAGNAGHGTPGFLDPAPVDAIRAGLQPERDVYAAAAIGWFCLTGAAPPRTAGRPPLPLLVPGVSRDLAAALEAGLNEDRRLRPTAAALATAVYRSAAPAPLDLSAAVHPTVIPELLTRRHVPPSASPGRLRERLGGWRRRIATTPRLSAMVSDPGAPVPAEQDVASPRRPGRHSGAHRNVPRRATGHGKGVRRRLLVPAAAAAVVLAAWLSTVSADGWLTAGNHTLADSTPAARRDVPPTASQPGPGQDPAGGVAEARLQAASPNPVEALHGLAALRDHAFGSGRLEVLDEVNAAGSPAAAADRATADRLLGPGHMLAGFTTTLTGVRAEDGGTASRMVVRATVATSAWKAQDSNGAASATGAATAGQDLRMVLVSKEGRWRISEILPGP